MSTKVDLSKATPRPWHLERVKTAAEWWSIEAKDGQVAETSAREPQEDNANAALIVAAVNAYDKTRELVERITEKEVIGEYERQVVVEKAHGVLRLMGEE